LGLDPVTFWIKTGKTVRHVNTMSSKIAGLYKMSNHVFCVIHAIVTCLLDVFEASENYSDTHLKIEAYGQFGSR
jgi:hypothetical protein